MVGMTGKNINRRRFLKGIGSLATISGVAQIGNAGGPRTVTLPKYISENGVVETWEVPRPWYNHISKVSKKNKGLSKRLIRKRGIESVATVGGPEQIADMPGLQIRVEVQGSAAAADEVPDHVEDIPVKTIESRGRPEPLCSGMNNFQNVPGGVVINTVDENEDPEFVGTVGWAVDTNDGRRLITARHTFTQSGTLDEDAWQWRQDIGQITRDEADEDWVAIDSSGDAGLSITQEIRRPSGVRFDVAGAMAKSTLSAYAGTSNPVSKVGISSDLTTGEIEAIEVSNQTYSYSGEGVETAIDATRGDSGGPIYTRDFYSGDAFIAGMVGAGVRATNQTNSCTNTRIFDLVHGISGYHVFNSL